jgi:membrane-associated phospholipid phosphatase
VDDIHKGNSLAGQLNGLSALPSRTNGKKYAPPICANAAMANVIRSLYANASAANLARIDSLENANDLNNQTGFDAAMLQRSRDFGHSIGNAVFNWSTTDGGYQAYLNNFPPSYLPPAGLGLWTPTPPAYSPAMLPYWGSNRTFVAADAPGPIDPPAPPAYSTNTSSQFYLAAMQVYNTVNNLTQAQMDIANYWADGGGTITPPGHNIAMVSQTIQENSLDLGEAATLFAKAGIALNDAGIVCWRSKYNVSLQRPITYIRNNINASWNSYIGTPPFPSYTSGHSSFSGACAKILEASFGSNYAFTDNTKVPYGFAPRSFTSFHAAAEEAAVSRLYGGIHYSFDNTNGYNCGVLIANNVLALNW